MIQVKYDLPGVRAIGIGARMTSSLLRELAIIVALERRTESCPFQTALQAIMKHVRLRQWKWNLQSDYC